MHLTSTFCLDFQRPPCAENDVDDHFGTNVIESMAASVIPVIHASGELKKDIVLYRDGDTGENCSFARPTLCIINTGYQCALRRLK
jgi:hypothetical protein